MTEQTSPHQSQERIAVLCSQHLTSTHFFFEMLDWKYLFNDKVYKHKHFPESDCNAKAEQVV